MLLLLVFLLFGTAASGCGTPADSADGKISDDSGSGQEQQTDPVEVSVIALKGPTAMGMVKLMDEVEKQTGAHNEYQFEIASSPDEVTPKLAQGTVDIAAVPANLASILYQNTDGGLQVLTVNTLGVLYITESGDTIHSVEDLRGKTIYASGKGSTPEYALNYILEQNGLVPGTDVTVEWKSEHAECVAAISADASAVAMLPQPFVTTAQSKNTSLRVALDLTEEWDRLQENKEQKSTMVTGVTVVRTEFAKEHPEAVQDFLESYQESVNYVNADTEGAAELVGKYEIVTEEVARMALPECNIVFLAGQEMKEKLSGYLSVLKEQNPESIGGALPGDDFYYTE